MRWLIGLGLALTLMGFVSVRQSVADHSAQSVDNQCEKNEHCPQSSESRVCCLDSDGVKRCRQSCLPQ